MKVKVAPRKMLLTLLLDYINRMDVRYGNGRDYDKTKELKEEVMKELESTKRDEAAMNR